MSEQQMREAFEKVFPMPPECMWCGHGYAAKEYNAWDAHNYCERWIGWRAALSQPAPQGVAETMELAGNYAETRHRCGSHLYSTTSLAARGRVEQAITAIMQERDAHRAALDPAVAEIVKLKARVAELERDAARDAAMKQCGARLSNLAYNWAQHEGKTLTKADCNELNSLRHDWDASIASAKEPSHG